MAIFLKKALLYIEKDLKKNFPKLQFNYGVKEGAANADLMITAKDVKGDIYVRFIVDQDKNAFYFGFEGKYEKNEKLLALVNKLNTNGIGHLFKVCISEDNTMFLYHSFLCCEESTLKSYASRIMEEFLDIIHLKMFQELLDMAK